jgi:hypothetical protein
MNRNVKAVLMGVGLLFGLYLVMQVLRVVWILGILMFPFLIVAALIYFVGYGAPNFGTFGRKLHKAAEKRAREFLDWLDFKAPTWAWPAIRATRMGLDWLGLQVAKAR